MFANLVWIWSFIPLKIIFITFKNPVFFLAWDI